MVIDFLCPILTTVPDLFWIQTKLNIAEMIWNYSIGHTD